MSKKNNVNNEGSKVEEIENNTLELVLSNSTKISFFDDILPSLSSSHEEIAGIEQDVFKFSYSKGKTEQTIVVRDPVAVTAMTNIEKVASLVGASGLFIVKEMRKIPDIVIEKSGLSPLQFFRNAFAKVLDENTIDRYFRISRIFINPNTFEYRNGIEATTSVSNLDVALRLFKFKERKVVVADLNEEELLEEYNNFAKEYIVSGKLNLALTQKKLKTEVDTLLKGVIDNKDNSSSTSDNSDNSATTSDNSNNSTSNSDNNGSTNANSDNSSNKGNKLNTSDAEQKNFDKIAEAIAIIRNLLVDDEIKEKFNDVVAYIQNNVG